MSKWVPFVAHFKVNPYQGLRQETIRDMQKKAVLFYDALKDNTSLNLANPGGGQALYGDSSSKYSGGCAIKPQFGNSPPLISIAGYYNTSSVNSQVYADQSVISSNELSTGAGGNNKYRDIPSTTVNNEVKALRTLLEAELDSFLPASIAFETFRIEYSGVVFGDRGYHFPI